MMCSEGVSEQPPLLPGGCANLRFRRFLGRVIDSFPGSNSHTDVTLPHPGKLLRLGAPLKAKSRFGNTLRGSAPDAIRGV